MTPSKLSPCRFVAKRIAIIGAGPSGLAAAKYLEAENFYDAIDIYEQRSNPGGLWKYTPETAGDGLFAIPQTSPHVDLEQPVPAKQVNGEHTSPSNGSTFLSPMYEQLETNIPKSLMGFSDTPFDRELQLFPRHADVQVYLEGYCAGVQSKVNFGTQVLDVRLKGVNENTGQDEWIVKYKTIGEQEAHTLVYNAVVAANGHYAVPYIPNITGLKAWHAEYPDSISHSKYYRTPGAYTNKKVTVVGSSASGLDIASQISTVARSPVFQSQKSVSELAASFENKRCIELVSQIESVDPATKEVVFADGRRERDVDFILFCTGYLYSFPFLEGLQPNPIGDGTRVEHTYKHLLYTPRPSLAFMVLPQKVIPFPLAEAQAAVLARLWSGRLTLPPEEEMIAWEKSVLDERGAGGAFHTLKFPKDADYINELYDWAAGAEKREGLGKDGKGKLPRRWGALEYWARENFPAIRKAFLARGEGKRDVRTLQDVGFELPATATDEDVARKKENTLSN